MNKYIARAIKPIFIFLVITFFVLYLRDVDFSNLNNLRIDWTLLSIASFISLGFRYWGVIIWRFILKDLSPQELPSFSIMSSIYAKAWMARYIPGTVAWIAGKIHMASKLGIPKSRLAVSSLLEGGMQVVATISISLLILSFDSRVDVFGLGLKIVMLLIAIISTALLAPPVFNRVVGFTYKSIRKQEASHELRVNNKAVVRSYALYTLGAFIAGSSYYFLCAALSPQVDLSMYFFIVGAFSLAGALGMATPLVPSGLGVRDGAQLVLLSLILPKEMALIITIFSRLWSALVDMLFYLIAVTYHKIK